eukprot:7720118-Pyramimonas_sp.AAC.1
MSAAPGAARLRPGAGRCTLPPRRPRWPWRCAAQARPSAMRMSAHRVSLLPVFTRWRCRAGFLPAVHRRPVGHERPPRQRPLLKQAATWSWIGLPPRASSASPGGAMLHIAFVVLLFFLGVDL